MQVAVVPSIYLSAICASNLSSWSRVRAPALSALDIEEVDDPRVPGSEAKWIPHPWEEIRNGSCGLPVRHPKAAYYAQNPYEILSRFYQTQIYI